LKGNLQYTSTRSGDVKILSAEAIVKGIAEDGGLYVPENIPSIDRSFSELSALDYKELSLYILGKFLTDFTSREIKYCIDNAYDEKFDTPEIAPLKKIGDMFFLELYHGATGAFKDMALSILPHLLTMAAKKTGIEKEIVILTATSGDTGKAALESFSGVEGTRIIVFYPDSGVSLVQERQMITQEGKNTFVCGIEGNFDDAQNGVKKIFKDRAFNEICRKNNFMFSSANSINIGRLLPQIVYYVSAYLRLMDMGEIGEGEEINVVVPTGNFGNILAAYYAKGMGLPVKKFICASNENNVLYDFINTGVYNRMRDLKLTISPSMDILISSNLERLIYDLCDKDAKKLSSLFEELSGSGSFTISPYMKEKLEDFWGGFATDIQTVSAIKEAYDKYKYLIDTHTAVGYFVYRCYLEEMQDRTKSVIASTASPFKFPASVVKAIAENFSIYRQLNEFELLGKLSELTGFEIPGPLRDIGKKKILHDNTCSIDEMEDFVAGVLGIK
jgi:threonine synthase